VRYERSAHTQDRGPGVPDSRVFSLQLNVARSSASSFSSPESTSVRVFGSPLRVPVRVTKGRGKRWAGTAMRVTPRSNSRMWRQSAR
jgi:hypothetical protein